MQFREKRGWAGVSLAWVVVVAACGDGSSAGSSRAAYVTNSIVLGDDLNSTYISTLPSLDIGEVDLTTAREFPGWADVWTHAGKIFIADSEAPELTRFSLRGDGGLVADDRLSFQNYGVTTAAFWTNLFVSEDKAYLFNIEGREVIVWNPRDLKIQRTFALPEIEDRGSQMLQVPSADRSSVVRGKRAFVPTLWANWDDLDISEDSIILVIDTESDEVLDVISVPCPNLNVGTMDDEGAIYFSNWVFSVTPTLIDKKARACAVRIAPDSETIDEEWSLTFADVTDGREAAALQYLGDGKALISVFHHERVTIDEDTDRYTLSEGADWRFWTLDLKTREAMPLEGIGWHAGGFYAVRASGRFFLLVPDADYSSTTAHEVSSDGRVEERWTTSGWSTRLFELR